MKYPDDFNTPAFPAGRFVAVSRFMGTAVMVLFVIIIVLCGIILWTKSTQNVRPFLVSVSPNGERWTLVSNQEPRTEIPASYVLQETVLNRFINLWFSISDDINKNTAVWAADCSRQSQECTDDSNIDTCAIYCVSSDVVFTSFQKVVLPIYSNLESEHAAIWTVHNVKITPVDSMDSIADNHGGLWRFHLSVQTNQGPLEFVGFARTAYDKTQYKRTMGYYIANFDTYRTK